MNKFTKGHVDLLPCPFCGNKDIQYVYYTDNTHSLVMCNECVVIWNKSNPLNTN